MANNKSVQQGLQNGRGRYWQLVRHIQTMHKPGDVVDDKEIEKVIGIDRMITDAKTNEQHVNDKYNNTCSSANAKLTQLQLRMKRIKGVGYRILYLNEYCDDAMSGNFSRAYGLVDCAKRTLDCVPPNKLAKNEVAELNKHKADCVAVEGTFMTTYQFQSKTAMNNALNGGTP